MTRVLDFQETEVQKSGPPLPQQPPINLRDPRDSNTGRRVLITSGQFKGYKGTVKNTNTVHKTALVELLVFGSRVLAFPLSELVDERCVSLA
jgi:hypothetical protein